jgi:hypothetical protein
LLTFELENESNSKWSEHRLEEASIKYDLSEIILEFLIEETVLKLNEIALK